MGRKNSKQGSARRKTRPLLVGLFVALLLAAPLAILADGSSAAPADDVANIQFEAQVPAPVLVLAASSMGRDTLLVDEDARFTFLPELGQDDQAWIPPTRGHLALIDPSLGEIDPVPVDGTVTPDGGHWAGAVAYADDFEGQVFGFARWNDRPIWTYGLPVMEGGVADQPRTLTSGGPYHAVGTEHGRVYLLKAADDQGGAKTAHRTFSGDNFGNPFVTVNDIAMARDGSRILIGTDVSGRPSLHAYSDVFFLSTFKRIQEPVHQVAISADGTRGAAVTGQSGTTRIHFLDIGAGRTLWEQGMGSDVTALGLSANGKTLAVGTTSGKITIFREAGSSTDRVASQAIHLGSPVTGVSVTDDGNTASASTEAGLLALLDIARSAPLWTYDTGSEAVGTHIGHDGDILLVATRAEDTGRLVATRADRDLATLTAPEPRVAPGTTTPIPIQVANNGNRMETIQLAWDTLPSRWSITADTLRIAPGETKDLTAHIALPKGQAAGTHSLALRLETGHTDIPLVIPVRVPDVTSGRASLLWGLDVAVPDGAPAGFIIRLENTGNTPNEVSVGYAGLPAGWRVEFLGPVEFRLNPGEDRDIALKTYAPKNAPTTKEAWFDVLLAWTSGEERVPVTIKVVEAKVYESTVRGLTGTGGATEHPPLAQDLIDDGLAALTEAPKAPKESKDSPGFGLVAAIMALGAVVLVARRRAP